MNRASGDGMNYLRLTVALAFQLAFLESAFAHGGVPDHGGVMNTNAASEVSLELVAAEGVVTVYLEDHDAQVETKGARGTLSDVRGDSTRTADLLPAGGNKVVARGVTVVSGDRITATLYMPDGTAILGRFVIR
jgi:hypothetical protein